LPEKDAQQPAGPSHQVQKNKQKKQINGQTLAKNDGKVFKGSRRGQQSRKGLGGGTGDKEMIKSFRRDFGEVKKEEEK